MWKKETLNKIHRILFCVMMVVIVLFAINAWLLNSKMDNDGPVITFEEEILKVSVEATEEDFLKGVTAMDSKDGDVTDTIMIESMSKLLDDDQRIISYVAFDGDNHVGKGERRIQYTDYKSPRFSLTEPLAASAMSAEMTDVLSSLKAEDCIDGDISSQIIVVNTEFDVSSLEEAVGHYEVQVTNSCGDVANLKLPVSMNLMESQSKGNAAIELSKYLIYSKVGKEIDPQDYVKCVLIRGEEYGAWILNIDSNVEKDTPGVYTIQYSVRSGESKAAVELIVVVEE